MLVLVFFDVWQKKRFEEKNLVGIQNGVHTCKQNVWPENLQSKGDLAWCLRHLCTLAVYI